MAWQVISSVPSGSHRNRNAPVRFFAEWCATIFNQRTEAEHIAHKAEEKQEAPKTRGKMRSLAEILVTPGSRPPESRE